MHYSEWRQRELIAAFVRLMEQDITREAPLYQQRFKRRLQANADQQLRDKYSIVGRQG